MIGGTLKDILHGPSPAKMKIRSYTEGSRMERFLEDTMTLKYNPAEYSESFDLSYETEGRQAINVSTRTTRYTYTNPADRTFTFIFDSTILRGTDDKPEIYDDILKFKKLCLEEGDNRQPNYLKLEWGRADSFTCRLKSLNIHYKLFNSTGRAIRAEVEASFIKDEPSAAPKLQSVEEFLEEADKMERNGKKRSALR